MSEDDQYWPIYVETVDTNPRIVFWNKGEPESLAKIVIEGTLTRLGKRKPQTEQYYFQLHGDGILTYRKSKYSHVKGWVDCKRVFVKLVDLKSVTDEVVKAFRVRKHSNNFIYFWSELETTQRWAKHIQRYGVGQNFDIYYNLGELLGVGGFSKVYKVTPLKPEKQPYYAAKVYTREHLKQKGELRKFYAFIRNEVGLLRQMDSEYVMKLYEVIQLEDVVILITEYFSEGSLYNLLRTQKLTEADSYDIISQLCSGLKTIHSIGYVHRDIKLENVMIERRRPLVVKLIDFGFSEIIDRNKLKSGQGTAGYIAPEVFKAHPYTEKADVFSLGVIFYSLITGHCPFKAENYEGLLKMNKACQVKYDQPCWQNYLDQTQYVIKCMLESNPNKRLSIEQVLSQLENMSPSRKQMYVSTLTCIYDQISKGNNLEDECPNNEFSSKELKDASKSQNMFFSRRSIKSFYKQSSLESVKSIQRNVSAPRTARGSGITSYRNSLKSRQSLKRKQFSHFLLARQEETDADATSSCEEIPIIYCNVQHLKQSQLVFNQRKWV